MRARRSFLGKGIFWILTVGLLAVICGTFYAQLPPKGIEKQSGQPPVPVNLWYVVNSRAFWGELARLGLLPPPLSASHENPFERTLYAVLRPFKDFLLSVVTSDWIQPLYAAHGNTFTNRVNIDTPTDWLDAETSIVVQTVGTSDYTVVAWMKEIAHNPDTDISDFRLYRAVHKTGQADWNRDFMPHPVGFTNAGDPMLAENFYTDGVWPKRIYYAGLFTQDTLRKPPNRIGVYYADEPYLTWSGPFIVEENTQQDPVTGLSDFFLDKPDIWVSEYFPTRGHVYVTYTKFNFVAGNNEIRFSMSTNGGTTWSTPVGIAPPGGYNSSQVLVDPTNGHIFVLWGDYTFDRILMSRSENEGVSWSEQPEVAAIADLLDDRDRINGNMKVISVLQARFNWVASTIGVVFHQKEAPGQNPLTDVYIARKTTLGWQTKQRVHLTTIRDQWAPGVDFDPNGQWLVSFFDRSGDGNNILYEQAWSRLQAAGTVIQEGKVANVVATDSTNNHNRRFVGDYQDVWWWDYPNDPNIQNEFLIAFPQLDPLPEMQGEMHVSGVH